MSREYQHMVHFVQKLKPGEAYMAQQGSDFAC